MQNSGEVWADLTAAKGAVPVEWINPKTNEKHGGEKVSGGAKCQFQAPFTGDAALYLRIE